MPRQRKTFYQLLQLPLLPLVVVRDQLHSLEHTATVKWYLLTLRKLRLEHIQKGFQCHPFDMITGKLLENLIKDTVQLGIGMLH